MAKSNFSPRKTLKGLFFSKSTTDLQECGEKQESKFHTLFKRKEKKKDKRVESPDPASTEEHSGGDWNAASIYATAPRSKKGLFSRSETDLHKPKRFATLSFAWKKKKKNRNLSQSFSSINVESGVKGHSEKDSENEDKMEQTSLLQQVHSEVAEIELVDNDTESTQNEDPNEAEFRLANTQHMSVPYIDNSFSDSDGYCTPPESPGLGFSYPHTVNNTETIPARTFKGHLTPIIPTPTSTVASSINSTHITGHHVEMSTSADSMDHSLVLHQTDVAEKTPHCILSPDFTSHTVVFGKFEEENANLALGYPEQSSSQLSEITDLKKRPSDDKDVSLYEPEIGFHRNHSHVIDGPSQDNDTFRKNHQEEKIMDRIPSPDCFSSISWEVPEDSCSNDPKINSSTEIHNSSFGENDQNPASVDVPLVSPEADFSPILTRRIISDPHPATFDLLSSSYTSGFNHSNNLSDPPSKPDHPKQEKEPQEPFTSTSLLFDTFNKSLSPESLSIPADNLTMDSYISDLSLHSWSEIHESEKCKVGNNLKAGKYDEEGTDDIAAEGFASRPAVFEMCYLSEQKEPQCFTGNNETMIDENSFYTIKSDNISWNESCSRKYSQDDGNAVMLDTEESFTRHKESDTKINPNVFQNEDMLGWSTFTTKIKENVEEKIFSQEQVFLRDEGSRPAPLAGESEAPPGETNQQLDYLPIIKPDAPVLQLYMSEECVTAPPCSLHGEVSVTDCKTETHQSVEAGSGHSQKSGSPIPPQWEDSTGGGVNVNVVKLHVDRDDITTPEPEKPPVSYYRVPRLDPAEPRGLADTRDTFQKIQKQHSADREHQDILGNPILQAENSTSSSRDTCGIFTERSSPPGGVVIRIREFGDREEEHQDANRERTLSIHQPAPRYTSLDWLPHAFFPLSTVIEETDAEIPIETCPELDTDMSASHVGVLSTTFTLRPKVSQKEREEGKKVHKVSLVKDSSSTNSSELHGGFGDEFENGITSDTMDGRTRLETAKEWSPKHNEYQAFESRSLTARSENEVSGGTHLYSSFSSSSAYEPNVHSSLSFSSEREWETLPSAVSLDTAGSHGNTTWWNAKSEVQVNSESESGGRSWEGLAEPAEETEMKSDRGITNTDSYYSTEETDGLFSGIFKATRVDLSSSDADQETSTVSSPHEIDTLVDTLKSMAPPIRHRPQRGSSLSFLSLPPIVEDATSTAAFEDFKTSHPASPAPAEPLNNLLPDLGFSWTTPKDMFSPLTMMNMLKEQQGQEPQGRSVTLPQRASALSSIVMRKSSLPNLNLDEGTQVNGFVGTSRLDSSLLFSNYRSEQKDESGKPAGRLSLFRAASLPEVSSGHDYLSKLSKGPDSLVLSGSTHDLSFLTSPPSSLPGVIDTSRMSKSPLVIHSPTSEGPTSNSTLSVLHSPSPESSFKPPSLQRSLSIGSPVHNGLGNNFGFPQEPGPDRNLLAKYKAFPDAYLTKQKEHGKLNPRPGKMFIYNRPGRRGQRIEVKGDVMDATEWEFPEAISFKVVRGGWVLYEKPDFKGEKVALDEGDIELTNPFRPPEDEVRAEQNAEQESGEPNHVEPRRFVIGSLRRAVRDYSVPEICLFPEENAEGKKVIFRDTSDDARIYGFPIKANSIIINAGVWLVYGSPFFQGIPRVLEVGGFSNPAAWGVTNPYISSLHPLKIGEPKVERPNEPKLVIYEKPYFTGKSREIYTNMRDFISRIDQQQKAFMYSVGSLKVMGGIWVGYEKEGFGGNQYLLEEGEYHDWRAWGGSDSELRSVRVIRTDLSDPMALLFGISSGEVEEEGMFEVTEAVPDVEPFNFTTMTRSIHVLSGAWVAYSHVDYSGNQYVLEKGFYNTCADWGSGDNRICSIQPILPALADSVPSRSELLLYTEPNFQGTCQVHCESEEFLPQSRGVQSCRAVGGSWVLYDGDSFSGNQYVLSEGDYANLTSMGCAINCILRSVKPVPILFTVPAISLFGLECLEGREVSLEEEVLSMTAGGFNPHFLSVRVNRGCWVLCEYSNYRGRQFLLEPMEITNWPKFSSLTSIGSLYPIREKRRVFRIRYKESGLYMSVQGAVDGLKTGRVVVSQNVEAQSDVWFYQGGLIKNKLAQTMSLQVVGNVEPGAKVVLWSETRNPVQTWSAKLDGPISSLTFPDLLLDVKGGKTYDKEHVIVRNETEDTPTPLWDIEII
ncbi:beta/gamma crystallin domain-containing protein 1 [Clarias gariepinus]|uniref:beta/gamma crystallin domain-containing protein 1 n=1 Tax=Clarias gariepinus TaxID=13013 RepID=UPI00234CD03F|nr:beta/gamma crystallin domain-containing protein 1 [Clarias gariepinus]